MKHDIVTMGAGHNGLIAAAYLAKAGKKVLVLERKSVPGGGVLTSEINTPGYKHDIHSTAHIMIQGNPLLTNDELELLSTHGLKYNYSDVPHVSVFPDGEALITYKDLDRTCAGIAKYSRKDAEAYRRFALQSMAILPMLLSSMYAPPPPLAPFISMMDASEEGREILNTMGRSSLDIVTRLFEDERVKIHLLKLVSENLQLPDELGTGMGIFLMPAIIHTYGVGQPVGGSGKLTEALVRCIEAHGGEVRCNSEITKITVSAGRAYGVALADGQEIEARDAVIGSMHPHLLGKFVDGIAEPILRRAKQVTVSSYSLFSTWYDLKNQAKFYAGDHVAKGTILELITSTKLSDFLDDFDCLRRRRIPSRPISTGVDHTHSDPTRAPKGGGVFHSTAMMPYDIEGKGASYWDEIKEAEADKNLLYCRRFVSNLTDDNITARMSWSPLDMERSSPNSYVKGDMHGCAPFSYQFASHRPTPDLGQFTIPGIESLYLVGPFMHPGGGVFGAGRATAMKMFNDMNIDFDRVVGK